MTTNATANPSPIKLATTAAAPQKASRMALSNVVRGVLNEPLYVILYGVEGVGKSTFAAGAPSPIFLSTEGGTGHLDVARFPEVSTFAEALDAIRTLINEPHDFKTLVIDTVDHLEPLVHAHLLNGTKWKSLAEYGGGYGRGKEAALDAWRIFMKAVETLRKAKGMHVIFLGHCTIRTFKNPMGGDFDRYVPKMNEHAAGLIKESVGYVLFARYESFAKTDDDKRTRGFSDGTRLLHTQWSASYDAKNRGDLPAEMPLSWVDFEAATKAGAPKAEAKLRAEIASLIPSLPEEKRAAVQAAADGTTDLSRLAQILDRARALSAITTADANGAA
jgi:hypothetical protein